MSPADARGSVTLTTVPRGSLSAMSSAPSATNCTKYLSRLITRTADIIVVLRNRVLMRKYLSVLVGGGTGTLRLVRSAVPPISGGIVTACSAG